MRSITDTVFTPSDKRSIYFSLITAWSESLSSEEARTSADMTSVALADLGGSLKIGRTAAPSGSGDDDLRQVQNIQKQSTDVEEEAVLLGLTIIEVAIGSTNTIGVVSSNIIGRLQNSSRWQNATSDLIYSIELMVSILKLSVDRVVCAIKAVEKESARFKEL